MNRNSERGSVLFYILIAVVLLAALSYAVAQSGRGSISAVNEEKSKLVAGEIMEYANAIGNAVAQLRLRGIKDTDLCFDDDNWGVLNYPNASCSDDTKKIFHLKGGGVTWRKAPAEAMDPAAAPDYLWHIYGSNEIDEVGTTCGADSCDDLILVVDELSLQVCQQINESLHVTGPAAVPPGDTSLDEARFTGVYNFQETIGDDVNGAELRGKTAGCFLNGATSKYVFYKVLVSR